MRFFLFFFMISCSNNAQLHKEKFDKQKTEYLLPMQMEMRAIGKGSSLPPILMHITKDSIILTRRNGSTMKIEEKRVYELISKLDSIDFRGEESYSPLTRDGGYIALSNKFGRRKFNNIFSRDGIGIWPASDTIKVKKYQDLCMYLNTLVVQNR